VRKLDRQRFVDKIYFRRKNRGKYIGKHLETFEENFWKEFMNNL
jgi:hypothetical protein